MARRGPRTAGRRNRGKISPAADMPAPACKPSSATRRRTIEPSRTDMRDGNRRVAVPALPEVTIVERFGSDEEGVPLAHPLEWPSQEPAPVLHLVENGLSELLPIGGRGIARLIPRESGEIEARIIRQLGSASTRVVGVFRRGLEGGTVL